MTGCGARDAGPWVPNLGAGQWYAYAEQRRPKDPWSLMGELQDKAFAAKVDRQIITDSVALLGVDLGEHIQFVID
jgi:hypothetical protein